MHYKTAPINLLYLNRPQLLTNEQSQRIHDLVIKILQNVGMEICGEALSARLVQSGIPITNGRVFFTEEQVNQIVDEVRSQRMSQAAVPPSPDNAVLRLNVSSYPLFVHDLQTGQVVPYTENHLIEMTKLIDSLAEEGVFGAPPGIPTEVHPDLQPLAQYRIAALYARQGATPVDPTSPRSARYLFEMAEVMGRPITGLPVYIPSPLRLGGESLEIVLDLLDHLDSVWVSSMPSTGTTAPIHPFGALALAAAEVIGGAILVKALTQKPVFFGPQIFPSDLREGSMVFGSPENMLYYMLSADFNHYYGSRSKGAPDNLHDMAKLPGSQAAGEKAAILMLGAVLGQRDFSGAGTLSLDEIFSPEQLLADCEMRDWVQRAIRGVWLGEEAVSDWLAEIQAGIKGGFMNRDSTLDYYRSTTWYPNLFQRGAIGPWLAKQQPGSSARFQAEARRRIASHQFELDPFLRREIERIYQSACVSVGM